MYLNEHLKTDNMELWIVRAGRYGEQEQNALDKGLVTIGWSDLPDLTTFKTKDDLQKVYIETYEEDNNISLGIKVGQIWRFANEISKGDLVALPSKTQPIIHFGKIMGDYKYEKLADDLVHWIPVKWIKSIPRSTLDQDLLYSFGSLLTVSNISRNDAPKRIQELIEGKKETKTPDTTDTLETTALDIEEYSKDLIIKLIERKFKGHPFARLVNEILIAQGYITEVSPPGPDGGVDILASPGPLGFEHPRICVQVKSTSSQVDIKTFRELQGVMRKVKAEQGLIVSWSGFNKKVTSEAKDDFFYIRLWGANELIDNIFKYYDKFSDELKTELPLKRFWCLVE